MGISDARVGDVELVPLGRYPDSLIPAGGRDHWRDWYGIRRLPVGRLAGVPGVQVLKDGSRIFHRSHLPLLGEDVVLQAVTHFQFEETLRQGFGFSGVDSHFADGRVLRPHQVFGACWIRKRRGTLLADGMRVGKTAQVVMAHDEASGPLVVSAPLNTRRVWLRWMAARWPDVPVHVVEGLTPTPEMTRAKLVFCHHEILGAHQVLGHWRPGTLAADEAHKFSNPRAIRTQGLALLATNAQRVVLMTGTPLWNTPIGLYPILGVLNPGAWGSWKDFAERYCAGHPGPWGMVAEGTSNTDELQERLTEVMLRRNWDETEGLEAPATERHIHMVSLSGEEKFAIDAAVEDVRGVANKKRIPAAELAILRRVIARYKSQRVVELSRGLGHDHHVIWVWHRELAKLLARETGGYCVTGETPATRREDTIDKWERDGGALVITMSVGEVGIDLSAATVAIFAELDWTPATIAQAEMRTFAPHRPMTVFYVAVDHRVERAITKALGKKLNASKILGVPAADGAIDVIGSAFDLDMAEADLDKLAKELTGRVGS